MTILLALTSVGSFAGGSAVTLAVVHLWRRRRRSGPVEISDRLSQEKREVVARDFAAHVSAVHRKVGEFADVLADGDPRLRQELRRFEVGGGTP